MATRELLSPAQRAQMLCVPEDLSVNFEIKLLIFW